MTIAMNWIERRSVPAIASFEFFPPKTEGMEQTLWKSIERLAPLKPEFVSVTYGAGGSTRERTHATVKRILEETDLVPAAHLTCVNASKDEVNEVIRSYWEIGVRHIVALRGDPSEGIGNAYQAQGDGYQSSADLVAGIKAIGDFEVSVSAYPEVHPESGSLDTDLDMLKRKIDAGATRAITQFFFEPQVYLDYLERVRAAGISIPIIPGIMPVTNFNGFKRIAEGTGTRVPDWMAYRYEGLDEDVATRKLVGASVAADLCAALYERGVEDFHFYTLNRSDLTFAICHMLGMRSGHPEGAQQNKEATS
jgi:methylenetetrahydrofolate reductase (NADPH)